MAYQIVDSELPGRPYAVIDTASQEVMGCHPSREAARIQMNTLFVNGAQPGKAPPPPKAPEPKPEPKPAPRPDVSVAYSASRTAMW